MKNIKVGDVFLFTSPTDIYHTQGYEYIVLKVMGKEEYVIITCDDKYKYYRCSYKMLKDDFVKVMNTKFLIRELFNSIAVYEN